MDTKDKNHLDSSENLSPTEPSSSEGIDREDVPTSDDIISESQAEDLQNQESQSEPKSEEHTNTDSDEKGIEVDDESNSTLKVENALDTDSSDPQKESVSNNDTDMMKNDKPLETQIKSSNTEPAVSDKRSQNLILSILLGVLAAFVGGLIWAETAVIIDDHRYAYMAIPVGIVVGLTVRFVGKGADYRFGLNAAILVILGCIFGNLFSVVVWIVEHFNIGYIETIAAFDPDFLIGLLKDRFEYVDIAFYLVAVFIGYKSAMNPVKKEERIAGKQTSYAV